MSPTDAVIRAERPEDQAAITALLDLAFGGPDEGLLMRRLRAAEALRPSLVAEASGDIVGQVALSPVTGGTAAGPWLGLAPVAVAAPWRRQGLGAALVRAALAQATEAGCAAVFVLGRPDYYDALGFAATAPFGWRCLYDAPSDAFRVRVLDPERLPLPGVIRYHRAFDAP